MIYNLTYNSDIHRFIMVCSNLTRTSHFWTLPTNILFIYSQNGIVIPIFKHFVIWFRFIVYFRGHRICSINQVIKLHVILINCDHDSRSKVLSNLTYLVKYLTRFIYTVQSVHDSFYKFIFTIQSVCTVSFTKNISSVIRFL